MYTCVHTCIYVRIYIYIHTYTYIYIYICVYIYTYIYIYIHTYIYICIYTNILVYVSICVYMHIIKRSTWCNNLLHTWCNNPSVFPTEQSACNQNIQVIATERYIQVIVRAISACNQTSCNKVFYMMQQPLTHIIWQPLCIPYKAPCVQSEESGTYKSLCVQSDLSQSVAVHTSDCKRGLYRLHTPFVLSAKRPISFKKRPIQVCVERGPDDA